MKVQKQRKKKKKKEKGSERRRRTIRLKYPERKLLGLENVANKN